MQNLIIIEKDELEQLLTEIVRANVPSEIRTSTPQTYIKGVHELARFLRVSPARAQQLKNEGIIPYFQDGRTCLFDPDSVRSALSKHNK